MSVLINLTYNKSAKFMEDEEEYIFDSIYIRVVFITLYTIVFCFCVFGNLLVILVVTLHWKMRNITKFCLGNLAFADFCVGIFCVYQNLSTYLIQSWVLGNFMCKMYQFIIALSYTASILILVVICGERYLAILHPLRCKQILTINRLRIIIVGVWLLSALYCSPRLYYFVAYQVPEIGTPRGQVQEVICIAQRTRFDSKKFDMIHFFLLFLLPLLVISVLYTKMGLYLRKSSQSLFLWSTTCQKPGRDAISKSVKQNRTLSSNLRVDSNNASLKSDSNPTSYTRTVHNTTSFTIQPNNPNKINTSGSKSNTGHVISNEDQKTQRQQNPLPEICNHTGATQKIKSGNKGTVTLCWSSRKNNRRCSQSESVHSSEGDSALTTVGNVVGTEHAMKSREAVVKMLIVIVLTFALCNFPFHLRKIIQYWWPNYNYTSTFSTLLTPLTQLVMYANCALNPIIYAFMSKEFRASFKDLLCGRCRKPLYKK